MSKTVAILAVGVGLCAAWLASGPAAAQRPTPAAPATLIPIENRNPALTTDRHLAAQAAAYRALHTCSGILSAGLPDELIEELAAAREARAR